MYVYAVSMHADCVDVNTVVQKHATQTEQVLLLSHDVSTKVPGGGVVK